MSRAHWREAHDLLHAQGHLPKAHHSQTTDPNHHSPRYAGNCYTCLQPITLKDAMPPLAVVALAMYLMYIGALILTNLRDRDKP